MDSKGSNHPSSETQHVEKKPYSDPILADLGSIQQLSLGGTGPTRENAMTKTNSKKHM